METDLKFRPFRSPADPGWDEAWAIYQNSFPQKEIRSLEDHLQALSDPHYTADGIWSDGRLIGILYYWTAPEYVYIEHLAISPDLRGANMGSRVLEAFCRKAGRIVLEIDPPETEIAVRRLRFYERLGFVRNDYHYVHPSFQRPYEPHQLVLMSYPKAMTDEECRSFERFVSHSLRIAHQHQPRSGPSLFLSWKEGVIPLEYNQVIMETARRSKVFGLFYGDRMLPTRARSRRAMRPR